MSTQMSAPPRESADSILALWLEFKATGDPRLRDRLVLTFAPMVKYIVFRKIRALPDHVEVEDLLSSGLEALIRAVDRYDPAKGATLEQYAWTRVHGSVLDELRRLDWAPRSVRRAERRINRAASDFAKVHGRRPTHDELADRAEMTSADLRTALADLHAADVGSLNANIAGDDDAGTLERLDALVSAERDLDPVFAATKGDAKARFRAAFRQLSQRDQRVAVLLYAHHMTLREAGEVLGVSESRVCQMHSQIRIRLRELIGDHDELFGELT